MVAPLYTTASGLLFHAGKILVITVGLPARGKTHISRALERYLRWMGVKTQVVSLGDYRRKTLGGAQKLPMDYFTLEGQKSEETQELRKKVSLGCEKLIWDFFEQGGQVVIYDANNGRKATRQALAEKFDKAGIHVIMLESLCDNKEIIERNIRSVKISSPDYRGWNPDKAVQDYYIRIRDHEKHYEPVEETDWPYIRILNVGEKIMMNDIRGYLQSRIVFFLMNIHNRFRTIYFARSGQSLIEHSYKADSDLSPAGWEYAEKLKDFVLDRRAKSLEQRGLNPQERRLVIWTSTRRRSHHTAWPFLAHATGQSSTPSLGPIGPGVAPTTDDSGSGGSEVDASGSGTTSPPGNTTSPSPPVSVTPLTSIPTPNNQAGIHPLSQVTYSSGSPASPASPASGVITPPASTTGGGVLTSSPTATSPGSTTGQPTATTTANATTATTSTQFHKLGIKIVEKQQMSEINPGIWDGLTPDLVRKYYPEDWERFTKDPYAYRAPRAESYHDLSVRLEPILIELEREQEDLLIIGHASVIRCLLAYLIGLPASEIPAIEIARGDLLEVTPTSYGVHSQAFHFWDGPGRRGSGSGGEGGEGGEGGGGYGKDENNFYENYAEDTKGKRKNTGGEGGVGGGEEGREGV
ncbi:bifunctional 6-phosphofructo-2-kinase/fructose-2,6-bisphosphate 2-phosphatase [Pluteus cervinus]|uniref:Bifunctional 6-phosphofructo-2-kinase/fructose-2,6-bisphosphate 2-phosphatase n=1 Tax=Pluteus cervinus TaxID=181527 RepID=A0ACD3AF71_9AGAR|nr:bifunctional 6-phosphofructo-2-kinase/fructose-2,6-bisphosphate 2-phosphatase [Pluteus cervinus]